MPAASGAALRKRRAMGGDAIVATALLDRPRDPRNSQGDPRGGRLWRVGAAIRPCSIATRAGAFEGPGSARASGSEELPAARKPVKDKEIPWSPENKGLPETSKDFKRLQKTSKRLRKTSKDFQKFPKISKSFRRPPGPGDPEAWRADCGDGLGGAIRLCSIAAAGGVLRAPHEQGRLGSSEFAFFRPHPPDFMESPKEDFAGPAAKFEGFGSEIGPREHRRRRLVRAASGRLS
jgi:hypothetical protein